MVLRDGTVAQQIRKDQPRAPHRKQPPLSRWISTAWAATKGLQLNSVNVRGMFLVSRRVYDGLLTPIDEPTTVNLIQGMNDTGSKAQDPMFELRMPLTKKCGRCFDLMAAMLSQQSSAMRELRPSRSQHLLLALLCHGEMEPDFTSLTLPTWIDQPLCHHLHLQLQLSTSGVERPLLQTSSPVRVASSLGFAYRPASLLMNL